MLELSDLFKRLHLLETGKLIMDVLTDIELVFGGNWKRHRCKGHVIGGRHQDVH